VNVHLEPPAIGLEPTQIHVRVVAGANSPPVVSNQLEFTTDPAPSSPRRRRPLRTTTTAQINGRVTPLGTATTYHLSTGPKALRLQPLRLHPCHAGGLRLRLRLVAEEVTELQLNTTTLPPGGRQRVGSPAIGADLTVHTRASNQLPGQSDAFPGPPGSDAPGSRSRSAIPRQPVSFLYATSSPTTATAPSTASPRHPISTTAACSASTSPSARRAAGRPADHPPATSWPGRSGMPLSGEDLSTIVARTKRRLGVSQTQVWRLGPTPARPAAPVIRWPASIASPPTAVDSSPSSRAAGSTRPTPPATQPNVYDLVPPCRSCSACCPAT